MARLNAVAASRYAAREFFKFLLFSSAWRGATRRGALSVAMDCPRVSARRDWARVSITLRRSFSSARSTNNTSMLFSSRFSRTGREWKSGGSRR